MNCNLHEEDEPERRSERRRASCEGMDAMYSDDDFNDDVDDDDERGLVKT